MSKAKMSGKLRPKIVALSETLVSSVKDGIRTFTLVELSGRDRTAQMLTNQAPPVRFESSGGFAAFQRELEVNVRLWRTQQIKHSPLGKSKKRRRRKINALLCLAHLSLIHPFNTARLAWRSEIFSRPCLKVCYTLPTRSQSGDIEHAGWELPAVLYIFYESTGVHFIPQDFSVATLRRRLILNGHVTHTHLVVLEIKSASHSLTVLLGIQRAITFFPATFMCHTLKEPGTRQDCWVTCRVDCIGPR